MGSNTGSMRSLRSKTTIPLEEPSAQKLFNDIRKVILNTNHPADLTFPNVPPSAGLQIATSFSEDSEIERALPRYVTESNLHKKNWNDLYQVFQDFLQPFDSSPDCPSYADYDSWLPPGVAFKRTARYGCSRVLDNSRKEGTQSPGWNEYIASNLKKN